jgi:exopolysaccharide biosynthesis polyprenyl glycosylphosphotransferase
MSTTATPYLELPFQGLGRTRRLELSERRWLLRTGDLSAIGAGILFGLQIWGGRADLLVNLNLIQSQVLWIVMIGMAWLVWLSLTDMYDLRLAVRTRHTLSRILAGGAVIGLLYAIYFFVRAIPLSGLEDAIARPPLRLAPVISIALSVPMLVLWRLTYARVWGAPHLRRRLLIVGAGSAGTTLVNVLRDHSHMHTVGFVDDDAQKANTTIDGLPVLGRSTDLKSLTKRYGIDEIVVAISAGVDGELFQSIMDCHEAGVTVTPMPLLYEEVTGRVAVDHIGSQWYVALPFAPKRFGALMRIAKRLIDFVFSLAFGVVFAIVCLPIIVLIKLDNKGPAFYRQERVGKHGQPFTVIKFRSMRTDAEKDGKARWAKAGDDRITRVGRILRKTRLDELPQILNVIKGEMSIVGPRPERQQFIDDLQKQIPFFRTRLAAKPGLTGWAQVNYGYGASVEDSLIKLQYDLYYLKHQSPLFDLSIILRTISVVLKMKGQ